MTEPLGGAEEAALISLVRRIAGAEILPRFRQLEAGDTGTKTGPDDLVTEADLATERAFRAGAADILPGAHLVGEESVAEDPRLLEGLATAPLSVVIDPVDGTWNYAHGLATFGVIVAVLQRGETVWGLLYDPILDDWVLTRRGGGTWFCRPGAAPRRLRFEGPALPSAVAIMPLFLFDPTRRPAIAAALAAGGNTLTLRCSCHEYRTMLTGGALSIVNATAKPWDHAAGVLAVEEAGGVAALPDGSPYRPATASGPFFVARDGAGLADLTARIGNLVR